MNKNSKYLFLGLTLLILLISIGSISATDNTTSTTKISTTDTPNEVVTTSNPKIEDKKIETKKINSKKEIKTIKTTTQKENTNKTVKKQTTHIINNNTISQYFNKENNYTLSDKVADGDTLDIRGNISNHDDKNLSMIINRPVNVISSTKDAYIDLNTTAGSLLGDNPGTRFGIVTGADYTNVTGINLHNTQLWVSAVNHVTLDNISAVVKDQRVGSGVGQTSIRDGSEYITVRNSYFFTENNGGSSTFVLAFANYCNIDNCTVEAGEGAGNLFYFNVFNINVNMTGKVVNSFNNVTNCIIRPLDGEKDISSSLMLGGENNTFINNTVQGSATGYSKGSIFINNTISYVTAQNITLINNTVLKRTTISDPSQLTGNNLNEVIIDMATGANSTFNNNTMTKFTISNSRATNVTFENNTINGTDEIVLNIKSSNNIIRNNYIVGKAGCGDNVININKANNIYENNGPVAIQYNITDKTYKDYFDTNGVILSNITNYSTLNLIGEFNNKNFTIKNVNVALNGCDAILNNATINVDENSIVIIRNITINSENPNAIILNSNYNLIRNITIIHNIPTSTIIVNGNSTIMNYTRILKTITTNTDNNLDIIQINSNDNILLNTNMTIISDVFQNNITALNIENTYNNQINRSNINITTQKANGVIIKDNSNITLNSNKILLNTKEDTQGITIIGNSYMVNLRSNTVSINSTRNATGIIIKTNSTSENDTLILNRNEININSNKAVGIIADNKNNNSISVNKININTTMDVQGIILNTEKITCSSNTINIISTNNLQENIGLYVKNTNNAKINFGTSNINAINASAIKLINTNNTNISGGNLYSINSTNTINIINSNNIILDKFQTTVFNSNVISLINSPNSKITNCNIIPLNTSYNALLITNSSNSEISSNNITLDNATSNIITVINSSNNTLEYNNILIIHTDIKPISLINSPGNKISNNYIFINKTTGGNSAIQVDENSKETIITNNTPSTIKFLNNQTYNQYFDKNGVFNLTEDEVILIITSDIMGVNLEFNKSNILLTTSGYHTLYNTTIIIKDNAKVEGSDLNIINTNNNPIFIINNTENNEIINSNLTLNGTNPTLIKVNGNGTTIENIDLNMVNIKINGKNTTKIAEVTNGYLSLTESNIKMTGKEIISFKNNITKIDVNYNSIILNGERITFMDDTDNIETYNFIQNNINITAKNPVNLIHIKNNKSYYSNIRYNIINVDVETPFNGRVPLINATPNDLLYNTINITDSLNNSILGDEALIGERLYQNNPVTKYHVFINTTTNSLKYNQDANITIKLEDIYHGNINGTMNITIGGKIYEVNGTQITISLHPKSMKIPIIINYIDSKNKYLPLENYVETLNVSRGDAQIQVTVNSEIYAGQSITLTAVISDNGELIKDGYVAFKLNGVTLKDDDGNRIKVRVINGVATLKYTIPSNYAAKDYLLTAVFSNGNYDRVEVNQTVTIIPSNVFIQPTSVYYENGKLIIKAEIKDAITNKNVAVRTKVTLKISGKTFINKMIVENGTITVTQDMKFNNGIKTLTIVSGPNSKYNVNEINVSFMVTNTPVKQSKNSTLTTTNENLKAKV
ncbi:beta strand repeat-containing protein [Methanosphaera cuniculi]|uniref:beta strand repeat-containing protein n=1 Tax=Methanosphaera cuniculi TaxID=1077256 RepID=UPI0026DB4541|nr:hypothetical protein [Methanosphaera cuniculi]